MKTTKKLIPIAEYKDEDGNIQWDRLIGKTLAENYSGSAKQPVNELVLIETMQTDDYILLKFKHKPSVWIKSVEFKDTIIGIIESVKPEKKEEIGDAYDRIAEWRKIQPTKKPRYDELAYPHKPINPYPHYPFGPNYPNTPWNPCDPAPYWRQPWCEHRSIETGDTIPQVGQSICASGINNTCGSKE